jgi:catalase (peroxidase I)
MMESQLMDKVISNLLVQIEELKIENSEIKLIGSSSPYEAAKADITTLVKSKNCGPLLLRLGWHDAGTYCINSKTGGPRGCMRFSAEGEATHDANAGLEVARAILDPIKGKYADISHADLWSLAACVAVEVMGGPAVAWRPGRKDAEQGHSVEDGRLPDASRGFPHLRDVYTRQGFNDQELVALSGAYSLPNPGHNSPAAFNNSYFVRVLGKNGTAESLDIEMLKDPSTGSWMKLYAASEDRFFQDFGSAFTKLIENGVEY